MKGELTADEAKKRAEDLESRSEAKMIMMIMGAMCLLIAGSMMVVAWCLGARFDLAFQEVMKGNFRPPPAPKRSSVYQNTPYDLT